MPARMARADSGGITTSSLRWTAAELEDRADHWAGHNRNAPGHD